MMAGGYSALHPVSGEELDVFKKAMDGLLGVAYEPLLVSEQIVHGKNYCFICNATTVTREPQLFAAKITIYEPTPGTGQPVVVDITRI